MPGNDRADDAGSGCGNDRRRPAQYWGRSNWTLRFSGAIGPTGINDDFTNRSISADMANVSSSGVTAAPGMIVFRNTIQNTGGGDDVFLLSAPTRPHGFKVEVSVDSGDNYVILGTSNRASRYRWHIAPRRLYWCESMPQPVSSYSPVLIL